MRGVTLGAWHLGSVTSACIAEAGHQVALWDQSPAVAAAWSKGEPPIFEPGLPELVQKHWQQGLRWAGDVVAAELAQADWVVVAYDTPVDEQDRLQMGVVNEALALLLTHGLAPHAHLFLTAQLPVGTSRKWGEALRARFPQWKGRVFYMPENLRLGEALRSFQAPDRVVVGVDLPEGAERAAAVEQFVAWCGYQRVQLDVMGLESAEMVKHALNAFLGTCVVFANELSNACEWTGADAWEVVASLKKDGRVGPKAFLRPGLGFAGGTIGRDLRTLEGFEQNHGITGGFFSKVYATNAQRNDWVLEALRREFSGELRGKRIAILGVTYKVNTSTVRRSPTFELARDLAAAGAKAQAFDPKADYRELSDADRVRLPLEICSSAETCMSGADAVVLMTEWPEFGAIDWALAKRTASRAILIDTKSFFKGASEAGWTRVIPGKPQSAPKAVQGAIRGVIR